MSTSFGGSRYNSATAARSARAAAQRAIQAQSSLRSDRAALPAGLPGASGRRVRGYQTSAQVRSATARSPRTATLKASSPKKAEKAEKAAEPKAIGTVRSVPVSEIHVGINPREHFDEAGLKELAMSIKENGLLQPISVRPHNGGYQIIAGERRFRAMQMNGAAEVPVIVRHVGDEEAQKLAILENLNRADMRPSETGRAYKSLQDHGMSVHDIANQFGKSEAHVQEHLDLVHTLEPYLQSLVDKGQLPLSVVHALSGLSAAGRGEAADRIIGGDLGVRSAKALIKTISARENQLSLFSTAKPTAAALAAHERYTDAVAKMTEILSHLDDETMSAIAPALDSPFRESTRLGVMASQLKRMQTILDTIGHVKDAGEGSSASTTSTRNASSASGSGGSTHDRARQKKAS